MKAKQDPIHDLTDFYKLLHFDFYPLFDDKRNNSFQACLYGIYAFIARGIWKYLILRQQFFFFDLERGYILFALDYISIIILFATISHLMAEKMRKV